MSQAGWFDSTGIDLTAVWNNSLTQTADDDMKTWYSVFAVSATPFDPMQMTNSLLVRVEI